MKSNKFFKSLAVVLSCGMILSVIPADLNAAATKIKIKSISVKVGQKKKISITGKKKGAKYSFKSSSKKTVSVTGTGIVKGLKKGKATITVKETYKKKKKTLGKVKVTVMRKNANTNSNNTENTTNPTVNPTVTAEPTVNPTVTPGTQTQAPTTKPTTKPTAKPTATPTSTPETINVNITDISNKDVYVGDGDSVETKVEGNTVVSKIPQFTGIVFKNPDKEKAAKCNRVEIQFSSTGSFDFYGFDSNFTDGIGSSAAGQSKAKTIAATNGEKTITLTTEDLGMNDNGLFALKIVNMNSTASITIKSIKFWSQIDPNNIKGKVLDISYPSTVITPNEVVYRKAKVLLPKNYDESKKYPVLYMNHGIFCNETTLVNDGTDKVIWEEIAKGNVKDFIAVFPNGCANKNGNDSDCPGFNLEHYAAYDNFINDLSKCLMPYMKENFSILEGRENTAICGFSMGGRVSFHIGFTMPETFGYIGGFCPAYGILAYSNWTGVSEDGLFTEQTFTLPSEYMNNTKVLIYAGGNDSTVQGEPKRYHETLEKNKVPHTFISQPGGGHDKGTYQPGLREFLKYCFK